MHRAQQRCGLVSWQWREQTLPLCSSVFPTLFFLSDSVFLSPANWRWRERGRGATEQKETQRIFCSQPASFVPFSCSPSVSEWRLLLFHFSSQLETVLTGLIAFIKSILNSQLESTASINTGHSTGSLYSFLRFCSWSPLNQSYYRNHIIVVTVTVDVLACRQISFCLRLKVFLKFVPQKAFKRFMSDSQSIFKKVELFASVFLEWGIVFLMTCLQKARRLCGRLAV